MFKIKQFKMPLTVYWTNGHYYEHVSVNEYWGSAEYYAGIRADAGSQGYLATVTIHGGGDRDYNDLLEGINFKSYVPI